LSTFFVAPTMATEHGLKKQSRRSSDSSILDSQTER
jgi:hypothetical protein